MRIIGLITISVWLSACSTTPMFPSSTLKDVESTTFDVKAWEEETYRPSRATFIPHKVELAGEIIRVIHEPDHLVILAEERPLDTGQAANPASVQQDGAPWFAVTFDGAVEPDLLQVGNRLFAVGTTYRAGPEVFGGAPRILPHLRAQCLHIWNTEGVKNRYWFGPSSFARQVPPNERTICRGDGSTRSSSGDKAGDERKTSGGS